mgnify:CR=1 FL=1
MGLFKSLFGTYSTKELKRIEPIKNAVLALEDKYAKMSEQELKSQTGILKDRLAAGETLDDILPDAFAVCREASTRVIGIRHYPVQIIGGIVLHQGRIAEMKTGEGKTFVAALPSYLNGLTGKGVHIVTVNDYLAKRDSELMAKVHRYLGLTVGLIAHDMDNDERRAAYACDITYATNNELGFDYLRDNMCMYKKDKVQREPNFAIVDEVDSILIDEARTPLIISGRGDKSTDLYEKADKFAKTLTMNKVAELDDKEDYEAKFDGDYLIDEKAKTCNLLPNGVAKAEKYFGVENLMDPENTTLLHHINQAIRANGIMKLDIDYVIKDGEIVIVDEFTGRLMYGRRFNDGLHQAIEAKEGVTVAAESKTLASITFQNYFRMYKKLGGMTGTASTEADEFSEIYGLQIVSIPTNKPRARKDLPDSVYKTINGKYNAVIEQVAECHAKGQPVLVGTVSVEKSEALSKLLKKRGIEHNVLNAKQHEREAEIVAQAGKQGAVTIATNMAGRGTDIMLGGNVTYMAKATLRKELTRQMNADLEVLKDEYEHAKARAKAQGLPIPPAPDTAYEAKVEMLMTECDGHADTQDADILAARKRFDELVAEYEPEVKREAEAVREAGGLFIIGTERHESRRIDNQLRGRAGRQGDPGASRFFLSLEDDLMRIFGGERVQGLMDTLGLDEDMPIENKLITNTIESAQKKLEASNFAIRKQVLQYDDVMNQQREIIYKQRQMVLDGEDISDKLHEMMKQSIDETCESFLSGETADDWDFAALRRHYLNWLCLPTDFNYTAEQLNDLKREDVAKVLYERGMSILESKEQKYGAPMMRELERICLLRNVDSKWMEHIDNMDQLKQGMSLRGYGQRDPIVEYRIEGFAMFDEMIATIREDAVHMLLTIEVRQQNQEPKREQVAKPTGEGAPAQAGAKGATPVRVTKIGRNDPCPCGSGLKWKKCTCKEYHPDL